MKRKDEDAVLAHAYNCEEAVTMFMQMKFQLTYTTMHSVRDAFL